MIDYKVDGDGVATITWDVDNRPMNVMNHETMSAYIEALEKAIADDGVKGVIVASAHKEFIVGADLSAMGDTDDKAE
ncbi:MAG: enoyl-CoA hydratase-related protein, partial [Alphaproteobacteria bacterium]|nr:enoyl-CoA hydratase-related protein [Alphaproteobacteria bacterium]